MSRPTSQPGIIQAEAAAAPDGRTRDLLALMAATLAQSSLPTAAIAFCQHSARAVNARRVGFALMARDGLRLIATNEGAAEGIDKPVSQPMLAAMQEACDQAGSIVATSGDGQGRLVDACARRLRQLLQGSVFVIPLAHEARTIGAVSIEFEAGRLDEGDVARLLELCEDMAVWAAPYLAALHREQRGPIERLRERFARWRMPGHGLPGRWTMAILGALGLVLLLATVPMSTTIGAPARVEGAVQRVIAAPVAGFVKSIAARPGDAVTEGQVVVELIDRDLQIERSRRQAEIVQSENAFAAAMARSDRANMMIQQAKLDEARAQSALIDQQLDRIQMRAPIDGLIIQGDLSQMIGAPVDKGQVLMTAAPRDQRRVIVEVDERDIHWVRIGQHGRLSVAALPWDWIDLTVRRITPMAQVVEGRNVFEVEADVASGAGELRPGLRGVARIAIGRQPPLQVWARRLRDHLQRFVWRWMP